MGGVPQIVYGIYEALNRHYLKVSTQTIWDTFCNETKTFRR